MYKVVSGDLFLRLVNSENKVWIVPRKDMYTALSIYQPSSFKGKVLRSLLPLLGRIPQFNRAINASRVSVEMNSSFRCLICRVLNIESFDFSIFEGTPSVHKKCTIQIFRGSNILAYCKVSSNPDIKSLFEQERRRLNYMSSIGIEGIPSPLYCGAVDSQGDNVAYVITTSKTLHSYTLHRWGGVHWDFIERLHNKTVCRIPFRCSDFAQSLLILEGYLSTLPSDYGELCAKAIERVRGYYGDKEVEFSAHHGDFTPWNMFVEQGELFVFDWEYSSLSYPPYLDMFHFLTQTAIFEDHITAEQIFADFKRVSKHIRIKDIELCYVMYLLSIISRYVDRERGVLSDHTKELLSIWIDILRLL